MAINFKPKYRVMDDFLRPKYFQTAQAYLKNIPTLGDEKLAFAFSK